LTERAVRPPRARTTRPARRAPAPGTGARLELLRRTFETHLAKTLSRHADPGGRLGEALRYALLAPGKRVRPLLVLTACEAVGGRWRDALAAAAAIECVHAFSLVHDDLPAMDDDDYRRGRLTTHKKYGEALGVLAGDALLAFAFEELSRLPLARKQPGRVLLAVRLLAEASGAHQLIQGQVLDLAAEGRRVTRERVADIHLRKTGALIACALALGAVCGGASPARIAELHDLGLDAGLAFQIHDDLLNASSSLGRLGKRAGTDAARGKATWPRAVGAPQAAADASELYLSIDARLAGLGRGARRLRAMIAALAQRSR
jgi:geranylgeranyl diphosphate synthase, type II